MAPKSIARDRIVYAASQSAAKIRAEVRAALVEHLGCEYLDDTNGTLRRTVELKFRWSFRGVGFDETEETWARCNYILDKGVPLPGAWCTAFRHLSLEDIAAASMKSISEKEPGLTYVECCVLRHAKVPTESDVGKLADLSFDGARASYFKCARIWRHLVGALWYKEGEWGAGSRQPL